MTPLLTGERERALEEALGQVVEATKYVDNSYAREANRIARKALATPSPTTVRSVGEGELLPCPKCFCHPCHVRTYDPDGVSVLGEPRVVCGICHIEMHGATLEDAISLWNTRASK